MKYNIKNPKGLVFKGRSFNEYKVARMENTGGMAQLSKEMFHDPETGELNDKGKKFFGRLDESQRTDVLAELLRIAKDQVEAQGGDDKADLSALGLDTTATKATKQTPTPSLPITGPVPSSEPEPVTPVEDKGKSRNK